MERHILGRTGVSVSKLCLGAMMFGAWGNPDHDESIRIIHAALDAGINFVDTADVYARGESEEIVGKALAGGRRDDVVLATKFHEPMGDDPNRQGNSRRWIMRAVEDSLRRLGTDWIDLYQVHRPRPTPTSTRRSARSATSCARARSATSAPRRSRRARSSRRSGSRATGVCERFVTEQPPTRSSPRRSRATCCRPARATAWACMSYSPLTGGWLSGRWRKDAGQQASSRAERLPDRFDLSTPANRRKLDAVEQLAQLADEAGLTLIQLAIAFVARTTPRSPRRSSARARWSISRANCRRPTSSSTRRCSTASTRSSRPGTTINPADNSFDNPALRPSARRR